MIFSTARWRVLVAALAIAIGCDDGAVGSHDAGDVVDVDDVGDTVPTTATLRLTAGTLATETKIVRDCAVVDVRFPIYRMSVSSGAVRRGALDDLEWHVVYENAAGVALLSEIDVELALPLGYYNNYKFTFGNDVVFILDCDGEHSEITGQMRGDDDRPQDSVNNQHGTWYYDAEGRFYNVAPGETMGGFEIRAGVVTNILWRWNINRAEWNDADDSGDWSDGDEFETIDEEEVEGVVLPMATIVVTYEGWEPPPPVEVEDLFEDAATGLVWQNNPSTLRRSWDESVAHCEGLVLGGHDDWRMPTVTELRTLVTGCAATEAGGTCLIDDGCLSFRDCCSGAPGCEICGGCWVWEGPSGGCYTPEGLAGLCNSFWSSSVPVDLPPDADLDSAYRVGFQRGEVHFRAKDDRDRVRCVRP